MNDRRTVQLTEKGVLIGDRYEVLLCGSLFYFRLPRAVWHERIEKLKKTGYNCVDVYFPWNYHEREDGTFDFTGEKDISAFLGELRDAGLFVIARPGPYICSEWSGGGLPARILESDMPIRCADERYLKEVERWYAAVLSRIDPFTYGKGGTVILLQLENELDFFDCPDPKEYISRLYLAARGYCADIPRFCCAGQYDIRRAGAYARKEIEGTLNCYPDSLDPTFDAELQGYAFRFGEMGKPLLVSETNRDHFLLRRELSCGAKLLGAYNQVAGNNFDHFQAINNWGAPDSFITSVYDFESMIDAAGNYRGEAEEAVLFSALLRATRGAFGGALPARGAVVPERCTFMTAEGGLRVLSLAGGGSAVCVPNFSKDGEITFTYRGVRVSATVGAQRAPFFLFGLSLRPCGIPATLTQANCELVLSDECNLVFCAEGSPRVGLDFGEGEILIEKDTDVHGICVRFAGRKEAVALLAGGRLCGGEYSSEALSRFFAASLPFRREADAERGTHFGALCAGEGLAEYRLRIPEGARLFIERPCDMLRVIGETRGETLFADGRDLLLPPCGGEITVEAEKWGHCNFDDPQSPALRIAGKKGVLSFGVGEEERVERCDFCLLDKFGEDFIETDGGMPVRIGINKWNSTRKPVFCAYTTEVTRRRERLFVKTTEAVETVIYLNGKKLGSCDFGTFELTESLKKGERGKLTVVYRKQVWTQDCGSLRLWHTDGIKPQSVRVRTSRELLGMAEAGGAVALPLRVEGERALFTEFTAPREGYLKFTGKSLKITCVAGGRVTGRALVGWKNAPKLEGGDADLLYFCPAWNGKVFLLAEALGADACLEQVEFLSVR